VNLHRPLLFDLQALIDWADADVPLPVREQVAAGYQIHVSMITLWEFLLKQTRYKFNIDYPQLLQLTKALQAELLPIRESHLDRLASLAIIDGHKDPFDRLLVAQALQEDFILVGDDEIFPAYQKAFSLQVLWRA
jgi:PIN domain nuclease of toxin-antitoxin system